MRIVIIVFIISILYSCGKNGDSGITQTPNPELRSNVSSITLNGASGSKDSFNITSNISWTITLNPANTTWASLSSSSGSKDAKIFITAIQDNTSGSQRSASIIITPVGNTSIQPINISLAQTTQTVSPPANTFALQWQKALGGTSGDQGFSIAATSDGGSIIAANTSSNNGDISGYHDGGDAWLIKQNNYGNIEWQKALGGSNLDHASSIIPTTDGGYAMIGYTYSSDGDVSPAPHGSTFADLWFVKLTSTGTIAWQKVIGGSAADYGTSVIETADGGFIAVGYARSNDGDLSGNHGDLDALIIKLNNAGNIVWKKLIGGSYGDWAYAVKAAPDGGFIIAGASSSNDGNISGNHGGQDGLLAKLDNSGNIVWQKSLGGSGLEYFYYNSLIVNTDGSIVVVGTTESNDGDVSGNHGGQDGWVVKLTSSGNIVWQKTLGGATNENANSVTTTFTGDFVIAGAKGLDCWIIRLNSDGSFIEEKTLGGSGIDLFNSVTKLVGDEFVAVGSAGSNDGDVSGNHGGTYDVWAVKFKFQ
jgi:hypothetical protein